MESPRRQAAGVHRALRPDRTLAQSSAGAQRPAAPDARAPFPVPDSLSPSIPPCASLRAYLLPSNPHASPPRRTILPTLGNRPPTNDRILPTLAPQGLARDAVSRPRITGRLFPVDQSARAPSIPPRAPLRPYLRASVPSCLRASVPPSLRPSVPISVPPCLRAFVPPCLRASVPPCLSSRAK